MNGYYTSLSALEAASVITQVAANNIANSNTNGFNASYVVLTSGPQNQGVQVASISQSSSLGPAVISSISDTARNLYSQALQEQAQREQALYNQEQDNLVRDNQAQYNQALHNQMLDNKVLDNRELNAQLSQNQLLLSQVQQDQVLADQTQQDMLLRDQAQYNQALYEQAQYNENMYNQAYIQTMYEQAMFAQNMANQAYTQALYNQAQFNQTLSSTQAAQGQNNLTPQLAGSVPTVTEGSNTDVVREVLSLYTAEFMYSSNAAVIQTQDEMTNALLNTRV
ncbi:flagellar basal body rod C-terminal domain-containing protein [Desulfovibrio cuneatus]|uniref:flagellar basal body rod C-terminal domain-containing protein n=1 Tax=Desulfovibrio cuneatus TaxID=159728 RepID=UPI000423517B|nr:flagellar basal body rod C-terminal domain-containing protein [Desulfovibrio cuneatus]